MGRDSRQQDPLAELGFQSYAEYLASPRWRQLKAKLLHGRFCEVCQKRSARVPHHLTYFRVGEEKAEDFLLVCRQCHEMIHRELDVRYSGRGTGWKAAQTFDLLRELGYHRPGPGQVHSAPVPPHRKVKRRHTRRAERHGARQVKEGRTFSQLVRASRTANALRQEENRLKRLEQQHEKRRAYISKILSRKRRRDLLTAANATPPYRPQIGQLPSSPLAKYLTRGDTTSQPSLSRPVSCSVGNASPTPGNPVTMAI